MPDRFEIEDLELYSGARKWMVHSRKFPVVMLDGTVVLRQYD